MAKHRRDHDEYELMVESMIEVLGEERLLEHLITKMDARERQELVSELLDADPFGSIETTEAWAELIIDQLEALDERDPEKADSIKMSLIWQISGGQNGRKV